MKEQIFKAEISPAYVALHVALLCALTGVCLYDVVVHSRYSSLLPALVIAACTGINFVLHIVNRSYTLKDSALEIRYGLLRRIIQPASIKAVVPERGSANPLTPFPRERIRIEFTDGFRDGVETIHRVWLAPVHREDFTAQLERARRVVP